MRQRRRIVEQLDEIEHRLANAEAYLAKGENVEGSSWFHFGDWKGNSGHPSWMKNVMIPRTKAVRAKKEKLLEVLANKKREKRLQERRRPADLLDAE